ncbi:(4Fe-4S)-binding protein [Empedobacter tilapiae]
MRIEKTSNKRSIKYYKTTKILQKEKPWIKAENASSEEIKKQVSQCPSGALSLK